MLRLLPAGLLEELLESTAGAELLVAAEVTEWLLELVSAGPLGKLLLEKLILERLLLEGLLVERLLADTLLAAEDARLFAELLFAVADLEDPPPQLIKSIVARQTEDLIAQSYFINWCSFIGFIVWGCS